MVSREVKDEYGAFGEMIMTAGKTKYSETKLVSVPLRGLAGV